MNLWLPFSDPVARQLYAEIASIEEQHVTQYGSIIDPNETMLEKWLLYEANEAYNSYSFVQSESNPRIKAIWERFLDYELGHLEVVKNVFRKYERRDLAEILPATMLDPILFERQRVYVGTRLENELNQRTRGTDSVDLEHESMLSREYRPHINSEGSPTNAVAEGYIWSPGTEMSRQAAHAS